MKFSQAARAICFVLMMFVTAFIHGQQSQHYDFEDGNVRDTLKASLLSFYSSHLNMDEGQKNILSSIIAEKLKFAEGYPYMFISQMKGPADSTFIRIKKDELNQLSTAALRPEVKKMEKEKLLLELSLASPHKSLQYFVEWVGMIRPIPNADLTELLKESDQFALYQVFLLKTIINRYYNNQAGPFIYNAALAYYNRGVQIIRSYPLTKSPSDTIANGPGDMTRDKAIIWLKKAKPYMERAVELGYGKQNLIALPGGK